MPKKDEAQAEGRLIWWPPKCDIRLELPVPPSGNNLFINRRDGKGRAKSGAYAAWRREAAALIMASGCPREGWKHVRVEVRAPFAYTRDIDNLKPIGDILTLMHVINDDRWVDDWRAVRVPKTEPMVVSVWRL